MTGMMAGATLAGVAVVILLSYMNWQETRQAQKSLEDRIAQLDSRLTQLSSRVGNTAAAAPSGPDPSKVYTIKTEGALDDPLRRYAEPSEATTQALGPRTGRR